MISIAPLPPPPPRACPWHFRPIWDVGSREADAWEAGGWEAMSCTLRRSGWLLCDTPMTRECIADRAARTPGRRNGPPKCWMGKLPWRVVVSPPAPPLLPGTTDDQRKVTRPGQYTAWATAGQWEGDNRKRRVCQWYNDSHRLPRPINTVDRPRRPDIPQMPLLLPRAKEESGV